MTKEKGVLMKTLKDENLRAETRKYTSNLINNTSSGTSRSFILTNTNQLNSIYDNKSENIINNDKNINSKNDININDINKNEKKIVKKKKKIKKKDKDNKNEEKVLKSGETIKKGQKIKLLTYKKLSDIEKEEEENEIKNKEKENDENIIENLESKQIIEKKEDKNKNKKEKEVKPIIKDKEKENKVSKTRQHLLNSLNNLQYNYDNLMAIGVHGNKLLNSNNKK